MQTANDPPKNDDDNDDESNAAGDMHILLRHWDGEMFTALHTQSLSGCL